MSTTPMYHIAKSGEAVRCKAKKRCRLQHLTESDKRDYDALFGEVFGVAKQSWIPLAKTKTRPARQPLPLPIGDLQAYQLAADTFVTQLTKTEYAELRHYTETPLINSYLREPRHKKKLWAMEDALTTIDHAIARGGFEKPITVYRGVSYQTPVEVQALLRDEYTVGKEIAAPEYLSTSIDARVAVSFATSHGMRQGQGTQPVLYRILTSEGAPVGSFTNAPVDREVLLPRNKRFKIANVSHELVQDHAVNIDVYDPFDSSLATIDVGEGVHGMIVIDLVEV